MKPSTENWSGRIPLMIAIAPAWWIWSRFRYGLGR